MSPHCFGERRGRHRSNNTWLIRSLETLRKNKREALVIRTAWVAGMNSRSGYFLFDSGFFAWVLGVISGLVALLCEKNHSCHREAFAYSVNNCFCILIFLFQIKRTALEISQGYPGWERRSSSVLITQGFHQIARGGRAKVSGQSLGRPGSTPDSPTS